MGSSRKDTADNDQICTQEITKIKRKRNGSRDVQKNETKNIPKNFGKAIIVFI